MKYLRNLIILALIFAHSSLSYGQFTPQYPLEGNDAIHRTDERIKGWATGIELVRGLMDIADSSLGFASAGTPENALGPYNGMVVSLGDGGIATLTFEMAIADGEGPDFAVFENVFANPENDSLAFLELAFVEVSTDGERFVRFPSICNYQTDSQIFSETYLEAHLIHNLAGKHVAPTGTPFDLYELRDSAGININEINFVRIIDVVGTLDEQFASYDSRGTIINNPYPSPYPTSGFDLESVAVLNTKYTNITEENLEKYSLYPNPIVHVLNINLNDNVEKDLTVYTIDGQKLFEKKIKGNVNVDFHNYPSGLYLIKIDNEFYKISKL